MGFLAKIHSIQSFVVWWLYRLLFQIRTSKFEIHKILSPPQPQTQKPKKKRCQWGDSKRGQGAFHGTLLKNPEIGNFYFFLILISNLVSKVLY
jgi:hypothetical protein